MEHHAAFGAHHVAGPVLDDAYNIDTITTDYEFSRSCETSKPYNTMGI
ncbi:MAG: hypothetical protein R2819_07705 [Allomuricauda sp.]